MKNLLNPYWRRGVPSIPAGGWSLVPGTYNDQTARTDSQPLIPEEVERTIVQGVAESSCILRVSKRLPNMSRGQLRIPVLSSLITAYFTSGDTGYRQTNKEAWLNKYINAEEVNVIVPIPKKVLDDVAYDMWGEIKPRVIEAFGIAIDQAIMLGTNAPNSWPTNLKSACIAAGNRVVLGTGVDLYEDILGENGTLGTIEQDGFMVNGHIAAPAFKRKLRGVRDAIGQPLFRTSAAGSDGGFFQGGTAYELDGYPILFPMNGAVDPSSIWMFSGDWNQLVYSIRTDVTYQMLDQAVITDNTGAVQFNLPQQGMVALMATMRLGWEVPNPINRLQTTEANRYPFAALTP